MNIYKDNCLAYLRAGYSVIPDGFKKKKPLIKGWNQYSSRMPSKEEVTNWCTTFNETNIAVMLGESSRIIAIDVDTEDPELLVLIRHLLPDSPCEKVGKKGFTRFFRYSNEVTKILRDENKDVILELLSDGKKTTIPPSIHTSGDPYSWVGKSLLDIDKSTLPCLPPQLLSTLELKIKASNLAVFNQPKQKTGRHIALGALASKLISEHTELEAAVTKLIAYDNKQHETSLFTDEKEFKVNNAYLNALKFYSDYLNSINVKRFSTNKSLELPLSFSSSVKPFKSGSLEEKDLVELPAASGLLAQIQNHILSRSYVEQPTFALSAAISLIGTLASRKFTFQGATSNTYLLNIADSGSGKDSCQQAIKEITNLIGAQQLLGATNYPSEASIITNLTTQQVRLDIIDEASSFLKSAVRGEAYQAGIGDTLCELYSCSNSHYLGKVLATRETRIGRCARPHLNLLCSTTYKGISEGLSRSVLEKGLFARFLTFFGENNRRGKRVRTVQSLDNNTIENLRYIYNFTNPMFTGNMKENADPYEVTYTKEADKMLDRYHAEFDNMRVAENSDSIVKPIISRLYQQMMKIVLISAISNTKTDSLPKVDVVDVEFAYKTVKFYYQSIEGFVNDNLYDNLRGQQVNQILRLVGEAGDDGLSTADLTKIAKEIPLRTRQEILRDLVHSRQIEHIEGSDPSAPAFRRLG